MVERIAVSEELVQRVQDKLDTLRSYGGAESKDSDDWVHLPNGYSEDRHVTVRHMLESILPIIRDDLSSQAEL